MQTPPTADMRDGLALLASGTIQLTGTRVHERFAVEGLLGRGGMGRVYAALDEQLGRRCALKVGTRPSSYARLEREARLGATVANPALAEVYHSDVLPAGNPFFVMELVEGEDLRARVERGAVPWREALQLARQAAAALGALHGSGVIHRDVKPDNLIVDGGGRLRVLDLGIAHLVGQPTLGPTGEALGTPPYMAPEQRLAPHTVDARADVYGLGRTLYHLIGGPDALQRYEYTDHGPAGLGPMLVYERLRKFVPGVPRSVDALVRRMTEPDRRRRYANMDEVVRAIDVCLGEAGEAGARRPWSARAARRWWIVAAGVLITVLLAWWRVRLGDQESANTADTVDRGIVLHPSDASVSKIPAAEIPAEGPEEAKEERDASPRPPSPRPRAKTSIPSVPTFHGWE